MDCCTFPFETIYSKMGQASEFPCSVNILSVTEIQQIRGFCLETESVIGNASPLLIEIFRNLFTRLGIYPYITINSEHTNYVSMSKVLICYHALRISILTIMSVGLLCLHLRVATIVKSASISYIHDPLSGSAAMLRIIYWVFAPICILADRLGCLAHIYFLSVLNSGHNSVRKSTTTPPILSIYWQFVGDALLSSIQVLVSVTPAVIYQFPFEAALFPVFLSGIIIMMHTITALKESTILQPALSFWARTAVSQRLLMTLLYILYRLNKLTIVHFFIPKTFLLLVLSIAVYLLPFIVNCYSRQVVVEQNGVASQRAHMTFTESLSILKQSSSSHQHLKSIMHRCINGTYSAVIAMLSIVVPLYLLVYKTDGPYTQGAQYTTWLVILGAYIYGLVICALQFRAFLCFFRGSLEWDKRIEPYLIFYPFVMLPFYKMNLMRPHVYYFTLIIFLTSVHYSIVSSLYTELRRIVNS